MSLNSIAAPPPLVVFLIFIKGDTEFSIDKGCKGVGIPIPMYVPVVAPEEPAAC